LLFVVTYRVENAAHGDAIGVHLFGPGVAATAFRDAIPVVACILGWWLFFLSWVPSNHDCRAYTTPPVARARKQLAKIAPWAFRHNNSEGIKTHQHVIQTPSKVIHEIGRKNRGHQNPSKPHQKSSEHHQNPSHDNSHQTSPKVIKSHQMSSTVIKNHPSNDKKKRGHQNPSKPHQMSSMKLEEKSEGIKTHPKPIKPPSTIHQNQQAARRMCHLSAIGHQAQSKK
jgi:hypothetical protein